MTSLHAVVENVMNRAEYPDGELMHLFKWSKLITNTEIATDQLLFKKSGNTIIKELKVILSNSQFDEQTIDALILTKNNVNTIKETVESVLPVVDHVVILDSGSTDGTLAEVKSIESTKIQVERFTWPKNFATARNVLLELSKSTWALMLDSDEKLLTDITKRDLLATLNICEYLAQGQPIGVSYKSMIPQTDSFMWVNRVMKNDKRVDFVGRVHEHFECTVSGDQLNIYCINLAVLNRGNIAENEKFKEKQKTYNDMIWKEYSERPSARLLSIMDTNYAVHRMGSKQYVTNLLGEVKQDSSKPISLKNINEGPWLMQLMLKLLGFYLESGDNKSFAFISDIATILYPNNIYIRFLVSTNEVNNIKMQIDLEIRHLLLQEQELNDVAAINESQMSTELLRAQIVKLSLMAENFRLAKQVAKGIDFDHQTMHGFFSSEQVMMLKDEP